jgi:hypothetical protein
MADHARLVQLLVEALLQAQHDLGVVNGCAVTDSPEIEARLPARLGKQFWRADNAGSLRAIEDALAAAAAAGFPGEATAAPLVVEAARPRPRLAVDNDA